MLERLATLAMGARFELVLEGRDGAHARAAGEAALEEIERCDARWSLFRSDSLIARVNREAAQREVQLDADTFELLAACDASRELTAGAFDIAVGARMAELGFRSGVGRAENDATSKYGAFALDGRRRMIRFTSPGTQLDLGAVAKGEALDRAAGVLRECGIERALLHGGTSSVLALGAPPDCAGWRVELAGFEPAREVQLCGRALSVSAPRGRLARRAGRESGHVLDPRTGEPLPLDLRVAVLGPSGRMSEAWSTAALVLLARGLDPRALAPEALELFTAATAQSPQAIHAPIQAQLQVPSPAPSIR